MLAQAGREAQTPGRHGIRGHQISGQDLKNLAGSQLYREPLRVPVEVADLPLQPILMGRGRPARATCAPGTNAMLNTYFEAFSDQGLERRKRHGGHSNPHMRDPSQDSLGFGDLYIVMMREHLEQLKATFETKRPGDM